MASTCRKCGAPIIWLKTPKGKWMPADEGLVAYQASREGTDYLVTQDGELVRCYLEFDGKPTGMARVPHWATCPFADEFHRGGNRNG